jgi:hypothetical protein
MKGKKNTAVEIPPVTGSRITKIRRMNKREAKANGFSGLIVLLDTGVRLLADGDKLAGAFEQELFYLAPEK